MASNAMTPEPGGPDCCCPCGDSSGENNSGEMPLESSKVGGTESKTCIYCKLDSAYFTYGGDLTCCDECSNLPVKTSTLSLGWVRMGGQEAAYFCYGDGWKPAGAGGLFSFLPEATLFNTPFDGRRVNSEAGTLAFDGSDLPQAELAISAKRDTTYFTTYDQVSGVYFEYFAGSGLSSSDARFGRLNRRYDPAGNSLQYNYTNNAQGKALLRSLSGNVGGNVIPYFYYADETINPTLFAPVTKLHILDLANAANSRTTYYTYASYQDQVTLNSWPYLSRIVNPTGCTQQFDPVAPFNDISDVYQLKRDVDAEGFQTYYTYIAGALSKVIEPEGRITYYAYETGETRKIELRRRPHYTLYSTGLGSGEMSLVTKKSDPLGNTSYFTYDSTLARITQQVDPNRNVTNFSYIGGSAGNKYATVQKVSAFNNAVTYFGYSPNSYDLVKQVGPRFVEGPNTEVTYYEYDVSRSRTAMTDALGFRTLYGRDGFRHVIREQDARGITTYFNYSAATGNLDSQADGEADTTYYGYSSFRDLTARVSPRWPEAGFQAFTTYHEYDQLGRKKKTIDALQNVTYFDWTNRSQLLATVDARGTDTAYTYNGLRLMTRKSVTDGSGGLLTEELQGYDIYKNLAKTQDALGNKTYFFYDVIDRLTCRQDALKNRTYFFYDQVNNKTAIRNERNNKTYFFYDSLSRNTAIRDSQNNFTYFFYDLGNNRTHAVDARLNATYYFYDQLDRVQAMRDALANPTYFYFDEVGNQSAVRDARFNSTYFFYDRASRQKATRDALGRYTYFTFDRAGNQTSVIDARQSTSTFTFDALDRMTLAVDPIGNSTASQYDGVGNVTAVDRGIQGGTDGVTTYFFYDGLNRKKTERDPLANYTYFFYDLFGNQKSIRNPLLHATYFGYDILNRVTKVRNPLGNTIYFQYDKTGNRSNVIDENHRQTQTRYDTLNRPDAMLFPDAGSVYFFYDQVGNKTKELDPRRFTTYFGYDAINRATRMQDALGRTVYFEYDPVSNLSKEIGSESESSSYTYDALNRRTNIAYAISGSVVSAGLRSDPYFGYDEVGNLTQMGDLWGLHRMGFDAGNRLTRHQYPNANVVYFEYDSRWNTSGVVYPGAAGRANAGYDSIDRQIRLQAPSGATAYFTYDQASNQTQRFLGNSAKTDVTYDLAERSATWRSSDKNNVPLTYFDYTRDAKGLITKISREAGTTIYHAYDVNDRLTLEIWRKTGAPEAYAFRYGYDKSGNRIKARISGSNTYYFYDKANQLTVKGTNAVFATPTYYTYDRNGSLTDLIEPSGTTKFAYNAAGLVARMRWRDASSSYFFYDGALRRYAMIAAGSTTPNYFLWEGLNLLQEQNADGTVKEEHTNAKTMITGIAQVVETNRPGQAVQKIYPIMDARGTITKWVQSDGTTVLASREYDAFGTILSNSAVGTWPGRFSYQGQAWMEITSADKAQRLLLSPTRIYNPTDGILIERDPLIKSILTINWWANHASVPSGVGTGKEVDQDSVSIKSVDRRDLLQEFLNPSLPGTSTRQVQMLLQDLGSLRRQLIGSRLMPTVMSLGKKPGFYFPSREGLRNLTPNMGVDDLNLYLYADASPLTKVDADGMMTICNCSSGAAPFPPLPCAPLATVINSGPLGPTCAWAAGLTTMQKFAAACRCGGTCTNSRQWVCRTVVIPMPFSFVPLVFNWWFPAVSWDSCP